MSARSLQKREGDDTRNGISRRPVFGVTFAPDPAPISAQKRPDFHPGDWILVLEALTAYSRGWEEVDLDRSRRAHELVEAIANEQGVSSPVLIR
jgi:hypothetical protein